MNEVNVILEILNGVLSIEVALIHKGEKFNSDRVIKATEEIYESLKSKVKMT